MSKSGIYKTASSDPVTRRKNLRYFHGPIIDWLRFHGSGYGRAGDAHHPKFCA